MQSLKNEATRFRIADVLILVIRIFQTEAPKRSVLAGREDRSGSIRRRQWAQSIIVTRDHISSTSVFLRVVVSLPTNDIVLMMKDSSSVMDYVIRKYGSKQVAPM
jgi:hypothetical protein